MSIDQLGVHFFRCIDADDRNPPRTSVPREHIVVHAAAWSGESNLVLALNAYRALEVQRAWRRGSLQRMPRIADVVAVAIAAVGMSERLDAAQVQLASAQVTGPAHDEREFVVLANLASRSVSTTSGAGGEPGSTGRRREISG